MPLLQFVVTLGLIGLMLWVVNVFIPMEATIKRIINIVVIIAVIFWVLNVFGLFGSLSAIRVGK